VTVLPVDPLFSWSTTAGRGLGGRRRYRKKKKKKKMLFRPVKPPPIVILARGEKVSKVLKAPAAERKKREGERTGSRWGPFIAVSLIHDQEKGGGGCGGVDATPTAGSGRRRRKERCASAVQEAYFYLYIMSDRETTRKKVWFRSRPVRTSERKKKEKKGGKEWGLTTVVILYLIGRVGGRGKTRGGRTARRSASATRERGGGQLELALSTFSFHSQAGKKMKRSARLCHSTRIIRKGGGELNRSPNLLLFFLPEGKKRKKRFLKRSGRVLAATEKKEGKAGLPTALPLHPM